MMFFNQVEEHSDAMFYIFQCCDLKSVGRLCSVSKSLNQMLCGTTRGIQVWLNLGVDATCGVDGFQLNDVKRIFDQIRFSDEFFWKIRLLVCPWHATDVGLAKLTGLQHTDSVSFLLSDDESRVFLRTRNFQTSFPSRPCDGFSDLITENDTTVLVKNHVNASCRIDSILQKKVSNHEIVPDLSHDKSAKHYYFPVHGGVYAVLETLHNNNNNGNNNNDEHGTEFVDDGVYFMSRKTGRMLRHIKCGRLDPRRGSLLVTRPTEMWIMTFDGVKYFGPSVSPPHPSQQRSLLLLRNNNHHRYNTRDMKTFAEKMDPALWMIAKGDAKGAIEFMQEIGAPLNTPCLISSRTLLHYAAMEGHSGAVRELIRAGAISNSEDDVDFQDECNHSALFMAVAELHSDVVKVLIEEGDADVLSGVSDGESVLSGIGSYVKYRPYALESSRIKNEIKNLVPTIVRLMIQKYGEVVHSNGAVFENECIVSCPEAVRMIFAAGSGCFDGCNHSALCFGSFRSRAHELSAIGSFYVMVREFGHDINRVDSCCGESAVVTLTKKGLAESVIMLIEHLGADPASKDEFGVSIRTIAESRARVPADIDGKRIVAFLHSRGL